MLTSSPSNDRRHVLTRSGLAAAVWVGLVLTAAPASAELVVLTSGRTVSVRAHRVVDGRLVLELRAGGEIVCDPSLVARIDPDEVPWPEPATAAEPPAPAQAAASGPYDELIQPLADRHGVEAALVRAVVATESAFQARARSPKGAMGLMQLMPDTARQYAVENPYDPSANLAAGIRHLKFLLDRYDMRLALAAYNAGEGAVRRHGGVPPFRETRDYIDRVLRRLEHYRRSASGLPRPAQVGQPGFALPTS